MVDMNALLLGYGKQVADIFGTAIYLIPLPARYTSKSTSHNEKLNILGWLNRGWRGGLAMYTEEDDTKIDTRELRCADRFTGLGHVLIMKFWNTAMNFRVE